jgi:hypothetical protein
MSLYPLAMITFGHIQVPEGVIQVSSVTSDIDVAIEVYDNVVVGVEVEEDITVSVEVENA